MNVTVSPQIRIFAIVGLLAAVGFAASMFLRHPGTKTAARAPATTTAPARHVVTTPKHVASRPKTKPHAVPRVAQHKTAKGPVGFRGNPVYSTLPKPLQWELAHHKIVVVSLYNPSSDVDAISVAEAHAGAVKAGAGFLLVNVLDNSVAGILTALLPSGAMLPDPGVLVYRAPGDVALRIDGFADRDSVAQAAEDAAAGETGPAAPASTTPAAAATPAVATPAPATTTTTP